MNNQPETTSAEMAGHDRLALGSLLLGLFFLCPFASLVLLFWIYLGLHWPPQQIMIALGVCLLEALLFSFAVFRIGRGNPGTKQAARDGTKMFFLGAALASLVGLILIIIARPASLGVSWGLDLILVGILPRVLITGVPAGGIGAAVLGSIWKHKWAAVIGGLAAEIIVSPLLFWLFSCANNGGC